MTPSLEHFNFLLRQESSNKCKKPGLLNHFAELLMQGILDGTLLIDILIFTFQEWVNRFSYPHC